MSAVGGVAHPSGYPLYVLWLRAWSWLPVETPAHAAALATAILTAIEVLVLHAACRAWGARPAPAAIATLLFVASPIVLRIQSTAEVFALNGVVVASVLWLSAANGPLRARRRVVALGLVAGLGLANHLTCVLVAPVGVLGIVRGLREDEGSKPATAALGLVGLCVGLLPYGYLLIAPDGPMSWRAVHGLGDLARHFLRVDYGAGQLSGRGGAPDPGPHLVALATSIGRAYLWGPALVGLGGLAYFAARGDRVESRPAWIVYAVAFLLVGPLFATRFNIVPRGIGLYTVQRMHVLPILMLAVPLAVTLDRLLARVPIPTLVKRSRLVAGTLLTCAFLAAIGLSLPSVSRAHSPAGERALENMLLTLPEQAVVIGTTDEFHFGIGYLQNALGERRDVVAIALPQLGLGGYRERIRQRLGFTIEKAVAGEKLSVKVAEKVLATGRPLFIDPYQANIAGAFPSYPYGLVFRILPRGSATPPIEEIFAINKALFERYRFDYAPPGTDDVLATQYHFLYARMWTMLADALERSGRRGDAQVAHDMAEALAPR
ncbi:MAG TPA: DUF2723 domain-containing protein [Kofleriaceae bacterium]